MLAQGQALAVNNMDKQGLSVLHLSVTRRIPFAFELLKAGADPDPVSMPLWPSGTQKSPMQMAAPVSVAMCRYLYAYGASPEHAPPEIRSMSRIEAALIAPDRLSLLLGQFEQQGAEIQEEEYERLTMAAPRINETSQAILQAHQARRVLRGIGALRVQSAQKRDSI